MQLLIRKINFLFILFGFCFGVLEVSIPDSSGFSPNENILIPIYISDTEGQNITSLFMEITYDETVVLVTGVSHQNTLTSEWNPASVNTSTPGQVTVGMFGINPLSASGTLLYLNCHMSGIGGDSSALSFQTIYFNEGFPEVNTTGGSITISQILGCTDDSALNYDQFANIDDSSCIFYYDCNGTANGLLEVDECGVCGGNNEAMDCAEICFGNNQIDNCGECNGNDWDQCDEDGDGIPNLDDYGAGPHVVVSILDSSGFTPGSSILIPVYTTELTEFNVTSIFAEISFSDTVLVFSEIGGIKNFV